jgi:hypothetical protein
MGTNVDTYVLIGTDVGPQWGKLPTDGQNGQHAYDDWSDRYGDLVIYEPKPGDLVTFTDMDSAHYRYIGRVIACDKGKWSDGSTFFEAFDVERLTQEIAEVSSILLERFQITSPVKLHIISNCS